jgi:3-hydroxymyristoyl/3-hydroxydecanoyl-(acyl carrier protein) dehydratase
MNEVNILELIPQRRPFVMIDRLLYHDTTVTSGSLKIMPDNIFVENGIFTESGIIESIAQTCAARMGYISYMQQAKAGENEKPKLGFIGSIKNFAIEKCPHVSDEITMTVEVVSEVFSILLVQTRVERNGELLASGEMKISITNIDSQ